MLPALIRSSRVDHIVLAGSQKSIGKRVSVQNQEFLVKDSAELLESDEVEAIFICSPPSTHLNLIADSLKKGKFVFCEKPGGMTSSEITKVVQLSDFYAKQVTIGYEYRYDPYIIFLKKFLAEINISIIQVVEIRWETRGALSESRKDWKQGPGRGGEVERDFLPHVIDYLAECFPSLFRTGFQKALRVQTVKLDFDQISVHFELKNVKFLISITRKAPSPIGHTIRIKGKNLEMEVNRQAPYGLDSGKIVINSRPIEIYSARTIAPEIEMIQSNQSFQSNLQLYATSVLIERFLSGCASGTFSGIPNALDSLAYMQSIDLFVKNCKSREDSSR